MPLNSASSAKPYHPTTFQERGVVVPFTTPVLAGTRARLSGDRSLELIVHNPNGGRGVYVVHWAAITSFGRPTLHDKILNTRMAFLDRITPATIRETAIAAAAEGLAGEGAMQAANSASAIDASDRRVAHDSLLSALIRQVNIGPDSSSGGPGRNAADLDARARQTLAWLAPRLGQPEAWVIAALTALADAMACVAVTKSGEEARIPRLTKMLRETRDEISGWIAVQQNGDRVAYAREICSVADATLKLSAGLVAQARRMTDDIVGLLRVWAADPESVRRIASRPEWLLDGWEHICLVWDFARDDAARRAALVEIANYVPILPREVNEWSGCQADLGGSFFENRSILLNVDWHSGTMVFDLIARNEQFRAAAT
jgi:hypothetical protein